MSGSCDGHMTYLTYIITPTDHRSNERLYPSFLSTSGANQKYKNNTNN